MDLLDRLDESSAELRSRTPADVRKRWGQYFTPPAIAEVMVRLATLHLGHRVRVLDSGAGTGLLGIAAAARLLSRGGSTESVHLVAVEQEPEAAQVLRQNLLMAGAELGDRFSYQVIQEDYLGLLDRLAPAAIPPVDVVIANPPYFKLSPAERRGGTAPNIYARFMEVSVRLLRPGGRLCFIVPRSYASGHYFRRFRREFHTDMQLTNIHLFRSRRQAFKDDGVLQENIIINCVKQHVEPGAVAHVTVSDGLHDLAEPSSFAVPLARLIDVRDRNAWLRLPESKDDLAIATTIEALPNDLADLGLTISTGPVVPFRSGDYLLRDPSDTAVVPLLWLQHVRCGSVVWPLPGGFRKPEYLSPSAPDKLRVRNQTCVLLRRFSAKEEPRRLTAAPLVRGQLPGSFIGIENHVNLIYGTAQEMHPQEALGLAALLNSNSYDCYFRIINGNTQVSASEIRAMRLPGREALRHIGERVIALGIGSEDATVEEAIGVASR